MGYSVSPAARWLAAGNDPPQGIRRATRPGWGGCANGREAMRGFLLRALISALGLWLASQWVPGVYFASPATLLLAAILLGVVNAIVRPIVFILTLPLTILTLGLFLLVLN